MTKTLLELIQEEGNRNNVLKDAWKQGSFPSEEVAREIGSEELYSVAANTIEFDTRVQIDIIKSNYYFVKLVEQYVSLCEARSIVPELKFDKMKEFAKNYNDELEILSKNLIEKVVRGYNSGW